MMPHERPDRDPFWSYQDILTIAGLAVPSLLIAIGSVPLMGFIPGLSKPFRALVAQAVWYVLVFGALYALFRWKYDRPFWRSLGWKWPFRGAAACLLFGPILALTIGAIGYVLKTPIIKLPFEEMLVDRPTMALFSIFVVVLGPLCEELAFRGFLMPVLMRTFGVAAGIVLTAILFGSLHAAEYQWSWKHVFLITLAGAVFGWIRYATGSTAGSVLMHATYNAAQLAGFLSQPK